MVNQQELLRLLRSRKYRPMRLYELAQYFGISEEEMDAFKEFMQELQIQGLVVEAKKRRFCLPDKVDTAIGTYTLSERGVSFVLPRERGRDGDIFIPPHERGTAFHGDTVVVRLGRRRSSRRGQGPNRRGSVLRVLKRANPCVVGLFQQGKRFSYCVPDDPHIQHDVYVADADAGPARDQDKVVVRMFDWTDRSRHPEGEVVEVLGRAGSFEVEERAVIRQFNLPEQFSDAAIQEARAFGDCVPESLFEGREDLRSTIIITIDPETAHDFDDGVSLERTRGGGWRLGVHIADVTAFVRPGSGLDEAARERGTSVYIPGHVIPMLPPELSSNLCSLKEGQDRLTKSVFITFRPDGSRIRQRVCRSVIRSAKRLTYRQAQELLEAGAEDENEEIAGLLKQMNLLAERLHGKRRAQGSLELDIPEANLEFNPEGEVEAVGRRERLQSHKIIEEFMLAANETVAEHCRGHKLPCIYRVHAEPEEIKLMEFREFLLAWGYSLPERPRREDLQAFLDSILDRPECYPISLELLRSLPHAEYLARSEPHFALAMDRYCHFTSPIRRYPDLIVHRILDAYFDGRSGPEMKQESAGAQMEELAAHCSLTERRAENAEREMTRYKLLRYIENHPSDEFGATIVNVRNFGFFVELDDSLLHGLVHVSSLVDDFYVYEERLHQFRGRANGTTFKLGDRLRVRLDRIDMVKRRADFVPVWAR